MLSPPTTQKKKKTSHKRELVLQLTPPKIQLVLKMALKGLLVRVT